MIRFHQFGRNFQVWSRRFRYIVLFFGAPFADLSAASSGQSEQRVHAEQRELEPTDEL